MALVSCSICGDVFEVADELLGDIEANGGKSNLVAYCALHEPVGPFASNDDEPDESEPEICQRCGREMDGTVCQHCGWEWGVV